MQPPSTADIPPQPHHGTTRHQSRAIGDVTPIVKPLLAVSVPVLSFIAICCAFLPYAGIQADEALFAAPLYSYVPHDLKMRAFHHDIPLMLMSYLGTLKTWIYGAMFHFWRPGMLSIRLPVVLAGALTVFLLYRLVSRMAGARAAAAACALIATDSAFILTTTFDWGPVAIQHLAYVSGVLCVLSGIHRPSPWRVFAGFAIFGLAMWDKAIAIWMLAGTGVAVLLIFPKELRNTIRPRNVLAAVAGFLLGATPLIVYNIRNPMKTFQGNAVFSMVDVDKKATLVRWTLSGSSLFGYIANEEWNGGARQPRNAFERASAGIRTLLGEHRTSLTFWAFCIAALAVPLWWPRRRAVLFALVAMAVAWAQMAFTKGAGTGVHHVVLLWPLPHLVIAVALAEGSRRLRRGRDVAFCAALGVLCVSSLLVVNQYLYQFIRAGAGPAWTDAIMPLSNEITRWKDRHILITDWGIDPTLRVLHEGKLARLWDIGDVLSHDPGTEERHQLAQAFSIQGVFVTHLPGFEFNSGASARVLAAAETLGYRRRLLATINDSNGRPVYEIADFYK